ncbi:TPA: hypothetical protein TZW83_000900 [Streptococcus suis]|nr:hypothetical protein [Streptococcus suis]
MDTKQALKCPKCKSIKLQTYVPTQKRYSRKAGMIGHAINGIEGALCLQCSMKLIGLIIVVNIAVTDFLERRIVLFLTSNNLPDFNSYNSKTFTPIFIN